VDDNNNIPVYQLHMVELAARGLAGMAPSEIRMDMSMIYREVGLKVEQTIVMDRDMFASLVRRLKFVADDLEIDVD
jgi:hypothetical protein